MKKIITVLSILFLLTSKSLSAGSSSSGETKSNYDQAVKLIEKAKTNEKKGKEKKAEGNYKKAFKLLVKSNMKNPNKPDTLNYLGFTSRKLGDYEKAEKYYLQGLTLSPDHKGINEYLANYMLQLIDII